MLIKLYGLILECVKYLEIIFLKGTINMNINLLEGIEIEYKSADLAKTLSLL